MKKIFITIIAMLLNMMASATDINGINYNLDLSTKTASVYKCSKSGYVDIPPYVYYDGVTYTVTSIQGQCVFQSATSVNIPNTVTTIGMETFRGCPLTSVTIPSSVSYIGEEAFVGCSNLLIYITDLEAWSKIYVHPAAFMDPSDGEQYYHRLFLNGKEIKDLVIPNSVTSISQYVFSNCTSFTSVTIPNSVTSIGWGAFRGCSNLTSVTIPNSVTSIGIGAFSGCSNLTSVTIPNSVTTIDGSAFSGCTSLTSVIIPNSVTTIDGSAFSGCTSLTSVIIPNSVTSISGSAFLGCNSLSSITVEDGNMYYDSRNNCNAIIDKSNQLVVGCKNTIIPTSVTSIGSSAFSGCSGLTSIEIPTSVTTIGGSAFSGCSGLTSIEIPTSVTSIGSSAFSGCTSLTSVTIPNSVTFIASYTFNRCTSLSSIAIPTSVTSIGYEAFYGCSGLNSVIIPNSLTSIGDRAFENCTSLSSIIIPNNVTSIGSSAFSGCSGLTSIEIPTSVTSIGSSAFSGCSGLTSIEIPTSVTSIGSSAFSGCTSLTSITIPNSVASIEDYAFRNCSRLSSITIGNNVTNIGQDAFLGTKWYNNQTNGLVYAGKVAYMYKGTMPNNTSIVLKDGTVGIATLAFFNCSGLTSVNIPNSVKNIGDRAFLNCSGLTSVTIPTSVTSIGWSAFYGCTSLTSVTIGNSVPSIGDRAFEGTGWYNNQPNGLVYAGKVAYKYKGTMPDNTSITIKEGTLGIAGHAFNGSHGLTSVIIPNSVKTIGDWAFSQCSGLKTITIPNSVTSIGNYLFDYSDNLVSIVSKIKKPFEIKISPKGTLTVPYGTKFLYESTEGWNKFQNIVEAEPIGEAVIYEKDFTGITEFTDWSQFADEQTDGKVGVDPNGVAITVGIQTGELWQPQVRVVPDVLDLEKGGNYRVVVTAKFPTNGSMRISMGSWSDYYQDVFPITATDDFQEIVCDFYDWPANFKDAHILFQCGDFKGTTIVKKIQVIDMGDTVIPFSVGGISYLLNLKDKIAKVTQNPQKNQGNVTIPATITYKGEVYTVTSIDKNAFQGCGGLTSVTIPNSVTRIEDYAFSGCSGLTSVIIPNSVTVIGENTFYNCSSLTSVTIPNSVISIGYYAFASCSSLSSVTIGNSLTYIGRYVFDDCNYLKYICLTSDTYPSYQPLSNMNCQYIMPQSAFNAGIPQDITNYATYTVAPKYIKVKSTTATTATLELTPIDLTGGSTGATPYEVTMYGLNPGSSVKGSWELGTKDRGLASIPTVTTKNLVMNVQPAKLLSKEKAGLTATVNEPDDDKHYGFEWQRNDAPSNMTPYQVNAQLYEGKIIGTLSGLDPDKYYKYRPFYKADDGTLFRGEWEAFITGDATVKFEPDVHTKESVIRPDGNIVLTLVLADGTEMTLEKGFELRIIVRQAATRSDWSAEDENITRVVVSGDGTSATVEGLEPGTEYAYRAYVKTESGTIYGEEKTFKTPLPGDANDNGAVDAADIVELVNAKAGHPSASFNLNNADANADGTFTEADITATANIIMKR